MDDHWFELPPGGDLHQPGIYQWWLDGTPIYTGRAVDPGRRLRQYICNLRRLRHNAEYRRNNPRGFRGVHHRLRSAIDAGVRIEFRVVENCPVQSLNSRERHHQKLMVVNSPLTGSK